ncbi:Iq-domain 1 [Hibiscus syriacus]|uniref:Iq-domain 1 n=1 Tax=Hibiscus syriacus TaxID=106335 RepID=A0A6A3D3L6_HIBSY|nr:Iq-domain 1 [Hibiscus syriacus]
MPPTPPPPFTLGSNFSESKSLWSEPRPVPSQPEILNSPELMSSLDADSFSFSPFLNRETINPNFSKSESLSKPPLSRASLLDKFQAENADPNLSKGTTFSRSSLQKKFESGNDSVLGPSLFDTFEQMCPPNGGNRIVIYTTTLRGIRKTYEDCNAVRFAIQSFGIVICERDISMDQEEVMGIMDEGWFGDLLEGLPKKRGEVCHGCGDVRFLPCFRCNGSCKMAVEGQSTVVVRCTECNENGLVHCPVCS